MKDAGARAALAISLLFFAKAACLALFVTPLWDVPDEVAHFAYAQDIAEGRGIPVPGRAVIPPDLVARWQGRVGEPPVFNWTAIHPPGYHLAAAAALRAARLFTRDFEWQVRLTRLTSALFGAVTLLLLYRVLSLAGAGRMVALAGAAGVGCIPMFSHMASGVSHDTLSAALGALCAIAWVRFLEERSVPAALRVAIVLALAGAVKATIAPVAIVLMALLPARLPGGLAKRILATAALFLLALSTTALGIARLGRLPSPLAGPPEVRRHGMAAFFHAFRDLPIADQTFKNFFGLIGWTGGGGGTLAWFQISGFFLGVYLALVLGLAVLSAAWIARHDFRTGSRPGRETLARWFSAAAVFLLAFCWLVSRPATSPIKIFVESLLFSLPFLSVTRIWKTSGASDEIVLTSQLAFLGFMLVYFWNVSRSFLLTGQMRGAHGRYYFVVLGFLLLGFHLPAADLLRRWRWRNRALAAAVCLLVANETAFYVLRVMPFYRRASPVAVPGPPPK